MNSLEWISGQIEIFNRRIKFLNNKLNHKHNNKLNHKHMEIIDPLEFDLTTEEIQIALSQTTQVLQILNQVKLELEAWEVVKKCLSISTDSWDEYSESFEFISFTVAGVHPLLGFDRKEIESIKKALEVE